MSLFADVVETLNGLADDVLQVEVNIVHKAWIGQTALGGPSYATPVTYRGIAIQQRKQVYDGQAATLVWTKAYVAFLFPVPDTTPTAPHQRQNPIDPRDKIYLPDGTTGPIVLSGGLLDGETSKPLYNEIYLGEV